MSDLNRHAITNAGAAESTSEAPPLTESSINELEWDDYHVLFESLRPSEAESIRVFHYTTIEGVIGITSSNAFHASSVHFMNDSSEVKHGVEVVMETLDVRLRRLKLDAATHNLVQDTFEHLAATSSSYSDAFVVSFCAVNNLLSQWRAYGTNDSRYSLEFEGETLHFCSSPHSFFAPVSYLKTHKAQRARALIDGTINTLCNFGVTAGPYDEETLFSLRYHVSIPFLLAIMFMKDEAFREEREWRLAYLPWLLDEGEHAQVQIRPRDGIALPYVNIGFVDTTGAPLAIPIQSIMTGPCRAPDLARRGIEQLLASQGRSDISASSSPTPLR